MQSSRCPAIPKKGLFRIFAILPQSRPRYLQSRRLRLDCGIETIQGNCFNSTKIAPCVLQDQSTDHDPSTIIAIMFWLQSDWQDCKVIHWVASELVGLQHCNIHEHIKANATSDSCRTTAGMSNSGIDQSLIYCETDRESGNNILMTCFVRNQQSHCNPSAIREIKTGLLW